MAKKKAAYPIVEPRNARRPEFVRYLEEILESGQCPFCPGGVTHNDQPILYRNQSWWVTKTVQPLPNTKHHFMITPFRHILAMEEITADEWRDFTNAIDWAKTHLDHKGIAYYWRQGDPMITGATVSHIHVQAVVPDGNIVTVTFGPYPKPKQPE